MSFPRLYFDEHAHVDLAGMLVKAGFDVLTSRDAGMSNRRISDQAQLVFAAEHERVLFTYNMRDFYPLAVQ